MVGRFSPRIYWKTCLKIGRFRLGRRGRFLTAPEKPRQISKIRQIFYDNHGSTCHVLVVPYHLGHLGHQSVLVEQVHWGKWTNLN